MHISVGTTLWFSIGTNIYTCCYTMCSNCAWWAAQECNCACNVTLAYAVCSCWWMLTLWAWTLIPWAWTLIPSATATAAVAAATTKKLALHLGSRFLTLDYLNPVFWQNTSTITFPTTSASRFQTPKPFFPNHDKPQGFDIPHFFSIMRLRIQNIPHFHSTTSPSGFKITWHLLSTTSA